MARLLFIFTLIGTTMQLHGQAIPRPNVPETISAPAGEVIVLQAHASGSQIYVCQAAQGGAFAWNLKAPQADLFDQHGKLVGQHTAGPSWKDTDGSSVTGKAVAHVNSPEPNSVPWLLLTATSHSGTGVLSQVTSIQRIHTKGGAPPSATGCDASRPNAEAKSSYTADYYFYAPVK